MKTFLQTLFFFLLVTQICVAQWYQQNSGTIRNLNDIAFDGLIGIAVGDSGIIIRTTNGGASWTIQESGTIKNLNGVTEAYFHSWIIVGDSGIIMRSEDPDTGWVVLSGITDLNLNEVTGGGYVYWIVGGNGIIIKSNDSGGNWEIQQNGKPYNLNGTSLSEDLKIWAVGGADTLDKHSVILKTNDGGINWYPQVHDSLLMINAVYSFDSLNVWAVGGNSVLSTTNGGAGWHSQELLTGVPAGLLDCNDVAFVSPTNGFIVGGWNEPRVFGLHRKIFTTTDGGLSWTEQLDEDNLPPLLAVYFTDTNSGWAVGENGTIVHTTNGGVVPVELNSFTATANGKEVLLNWSTATELNNQGFEVQRKFSSNDFVTVGSVKGHGTTTTLNNYSYIDKLTDAGKYFYRLKQIDYGGKCEYSQVVEVNWSPFTTYKLEQNYPNPFNPTTTIGFGIPASPNPSDLSRPWRAKAEGGTLVTLKVYDVLGNEVKTSINEEMEAGYHSVDFDASDLPSGVYFYQLRAGSFVQTRKMLLLR
jgi:photosystem II stability/assembly factor-like uncharacterized protein